MHVRRINEWLSIFKDVRWRGISNYWMEFSTKKVQAGELLINGEEACWGFSFIKSGVLRVYRLNDEGREVTLYRLRKGDSCFMTV